MKVLLLLLVVIGLAAADAWPGWGRRSADPVAAPAFAWLGRRSADPEAAAQFQFLSGRRSADPENSKFKAREASPGYLLEEFLKRRSADPENSKFKAREASPGYLLEEFLKRRSADPVAAAYYVPARARRSADPAKNIILHIHRR
ncbi:uncharacterized protein LOC135376389 isoform X3 [Ornithodoros turicata]|uniref:uncharacterized protein LOC135376389 isoform X2 n=1 Tax=Ornithodoros turicata TaxID=34597 RepID=UPI0031389686